MPRRKKQSPALPDLEIDVLLMSVIRANKHPAGKSDQQRLAEARDALLGKVGDPGRNGRRENFDLFAVFNILSEVRKPELDAINRALMDRFPKLRTPAREAEAARPPMSTREAARKYSPMATGIKNVLDESVEDRLRRKARSKLTDREMARIGSLYDPEDFGRLNITKILDCLKSLGITSERFWDVNS